MSQPPKSLRRHYPGQVPRVGPVGLSARPRAALHPFERPSSIREAPPADKPGPEDDPPRGHRGRGGDRHGYEVGDRLNRVVDANGVTPDGRLAVRENWRPDVVNGGFESVQ